MRKILLYMLILLTLIVSVSAADVGVIVKLADGQTIEECVQIADGNNAYDAFEATDIDMSWNDFGFGKFLEEVEGVASEDEEGHYWSFWHINNAENGFEAAMVGAEDYDVEDKGTVIGLSYTDYDSNFEPITRPSFSDFDDVCEPMMEVQKIKAIVDGDSDTIDDGDSFEVYPGSTLEIEIEIENKDEDYELDVEVEGVLEDIDDGDDLDEDDDIEIDEDDEEELVLEFDIPYDVDEDDYDLILTITGSGKREYEQVFTFEVEVEKDDDDIRVNLDEESSAVCGGTYTHEVRLRNIGSDDQDISLEVFAPRLGFDLTRRVMLDEGDSEYETFTINIPKDVDQESYMVETVVRYAGMSETYNTDLRVSCSSSKTATGSTNTASKNSNDEYKDFETVVLSPEPVKEDTSKKNDSTETFYIVLLILGNLLLIGVLVYFLVRK